MRILFIGDVFGTSGLRCAEHFIPLLRAEHELDLVVVNGENAARGIGIYEKQARALVRSGADAITLGNHALRQHEIFPLLEDQSFPMVRPANLPARAPGRGLTFVTTRDSVSNLEHEVAIINLMGAVSLDVGTAPFDAIDELMQKALDRTSIVLLDMHAEATSEKVAMGVYLDGKASVVVGTHTHVQTSDARVLPQGTAYITDLGMTGPHGIDSVIGVRSDIILRRLKNGVGERFVPSTQGVQLEGAIIDVDAQTGRAKSIEAIRIPMPNA